MSRTDQQCLPTSLVTDKLAPRGRLSKKSLPRYRHWIEEEVFYIIQSGERKEFLSLKSDTERENFWQICNPLPAPRSTSTRKSTTAALSTPTSET